MNEMAIIKATYAKNSAIAKASIRYIVHRPGKEHARTNRTLWGIDGVMERRQAYRMIDEAEKDSIFYRFVLSPDPKGEDSGRDLSLREITEKTLFMLEDRLHTQVQWVAAEHNDHAPHRHVHVVAIVPRRLQVKDLQSLRRAATEASLEQRRERDQAQEAQQRRNEREAEEGAQWER